YYMFGVMFREDAKRDPSRAALAAQAFAESAKYPTEPLNALAREQAGSAAPPVQANAVATRPAAPATRPPTGAIAAVPTPPPVTATPPATSAAASSSEYPFVAGAPQAAAYAVVIGVETYRDLPRATGARGDATKIAALLRKTLGLREDHVRVAVDDRATRTDIIKHLAWLKQNVKAGGRAYVYFSGHGAPDAASGTAYVLPYDGDPKFVSSTALSLDEIVKTVGESKAQDALVILDSCFSGAGGRSQLAPGTRPLMRVKEASVAPKVAVLSASAASEISGSTPGGTEGLFTHHLTDALGKALADTDGDGQVSLHELLEWVKPRVAREAKRDNRDQTPELKLGAGLRAASDFIVGYGFATR
ncbi:MAG TPA: caspase family protein, partial [Labilithrix sp.]|nr:caspase family protein [Labilithrix sp.]